MTHDEILKEYREDSTLRNFYSQLTPEGGIAKYKNMIRPEVYGPLEKMVATMPEQFREDFEKNVEARLLMRGIRPNLSHLEANKMANMYATVTGTLYEPKKFLEYMQDSIKAGVTERDIAVLQQNIMMSPDGEATEGQRGRLAGLEARRLELSKNVTKRGALGDFTRGLGGIAQSLALTAEGTLYAAAGAAATGILTVAGAAAGTVLAPGAGTVAGGMAGAALAGAPLLTGLFQQSYLNQKIYQGLEYEKLRKAGIEHGVARRYATVAAGVNTSIEAALSAVPVEGGFARFLGPALGKKILGSDIVVASARQAAARFGKEALINLTDTVLEGAEEAAQGVSSNLFLELAALRQEERYGFVDWDTVDAYREDIGESFKAGVFMAFVLGIPKAAASTAMAGLTVADAKDLVRRVDTVLRLVPDRDERRKILTEGVTGDILTRDAIEELAGRDLPETGKFRPDAPAPVEGSPAPFRLGSNGTLRGRPGNGSFVFLDPSGFRYGEAKSSVSDNAVTVESIDIENKNITNPDALKAQVLRDIAKKYPEYEIDWNAKDETEGRIRDTALRQIRMERDGTAQNALHTALGELLGSNAKVVRELPALTDAEKAEFEAAGDRVKGAFLPENALRAEKLVYLAKKADFTTLNHEMIHEKILSFGEDERREWADAVGLADSSAEGWNAKTFDGRDGGKVNAHEYIAEKWEDYLATPDNPGIPSKLKALFDRIAAAMRRVYEALGRTVREVEPALKAMFDRLVSEGAESGKTGAVNAKNGRNGRKTALNSEKKGLTLGLTASHKEKEGDSAIMADVSETVNTYPNVGNSGVFCKNYKDVDSLINASKAYENVGNTDAPQTVSDYNGWASRPSSPLPGSLYFVAGDMDIRTKPDGGLAESPVETLWISNREGARKYLLPNPRLFNQMTDIGRLYRMDQNALRGAGKNTATVTVPAEMTAEGFVEFPGELELNGQKNARDTLFSLDGAEKRRADEIRAAAVMPRKAETISAAQKTVAELIKTNNTFTNRATGISAVISHKSIRKLGYVKDEERALPPTIHAQTVANIDRLFENAQTHTTHRDRHDRAEIKQIHRFGSVMEHEGEYYPVVITVKEYKNGIGIVANKLYAVEAISAEEIKKAGTGRTPQSTEADRDVQPLPTFYNSLADLIDTVKTPIVSDNSAEKSTPLFSLEGENERAESEITDEERAGRAERAERIKAIDPKTYEPVEGIGKKDAQNILRDLEVLETSDGLAARFPVKTAGKILPDSGFNTSKIMPYIGELFRNSLFAYEEQERNLSLRHDGTRHKPHPDVKAYRNYVNKFSVKAAENETAHNYYIRFVVTVPKQSTTKNRDAVHPGLVHSTFISDIFVYEEHAQPTDTDNSPGEGRQRVDYNLAEFFNSAKPLSSLSDTSAKMSSGNEPEASKTLFQLTREGELEAAREAIADGRGREEFIADQTAFSEAMDEAMPDGVTSADGAAAWLGAIYDEAAGTGEGNLTTTEIDEKLEHDLRNNRKMFTNFMKLAGATLKYVPGDEAERALRAEIELIAKSNGKSGGYTLFENTARRAAKGGDIKNSTRQSLITYMSNDMTRFRDLYVRLTGDAEYIRLAENEIYEDFETGIKDRERMTPYELGRAKAKIRDRVLRDRITEGTATDRDYERVIEEAGRTVRELEAETAALEKNADALEEKLGDMAHDYARQTRILREKEEALVQAREEAKRNEETLWRQAGQTVRAAETGGRRNAREMWKQAEQTVKALEKEGRRSETELWEQAEKTVKALEKEIADRNTKVKKLAGALTTADRKAADAVLAKRAALAKQKEKMNAARAEEKAAAKLLADKRRVFDRSMKPPANNVDAKIAQNITALQAAFAEAYSKGKTPANVTFNGQRMTLDEFRDMAAKGDISAGGLPKRLKKYLDRSGINELSIKDAEAVMREIEYLKAEGRAVVKEKAAKRRALARYRIAQTLDAVNRAYTDPKARGAAKRLRAYLSAATSEEAAKILRRTDAFYRIKEGIQIDRLLELSKLDELKDLIAKGRDEANYQEGQHVNRRYKGLETLLGDTAKARNAKIAELGTENIPIAGIWHGGRDWHFSKAFLMTASIGLDDPKMRTYLLYGSLMSYEERADLRDAAEAARGDKEAKEEYKARVAEIGEEKEAVLRQAIEDWLTGDDLKIRDYIRDDFTANFERINAAAYEVDNTLMTKVESYLPVFRQEKGADEEISVNGTSFTYSKPENGFTVDRRKIPEYAVVPIETDIFKLFYRGVESQEHFAAFAPFVKELNGVFGGTDARGRELKDKLRKMHGKGLINVIEDYIAVLANPKAADTGSDFGLGIVGKSTLGYITWNTLSGMKQVPQSFTPFLAKVRPEHIAASALKYMKNIGAFNNRDYNALTEAAFAKSSDLRRRVQNTEREYAQKIKDAAKSKPQKAYAFFVNDMGMWMQRAADEFACVAGWDAAYNEKYLELIKSGKLTDAESDKAAVKHADSVLAETQPTTNPLYQSMAFRKTPKVFKFFSTPLEKLFQMAMGIPGQIKRGEGAFVARYAAGAAITGLALAVLQRKLGPEDGGDPEKLARKLAYYGIAEPAMAHLPLAMLSSSALWLAERGILKEKRPAPQRDFLPLLSIGEDVVADIDGGKGDRLVKDAMEFAGYLLGLPTVQVRRIIKAAESEDVYGAFAGAR